MPSGFRELGGSEVVVGALVAPGGDGSSRVGISGREVFTIRSTLGNVLSVIHWNPTLLACSVWGERVGDSENPMRRL